MATTYWVNDLNFTILDFLSKIRWLDRETPLIELVEPYRQKIMVDVLSQREDGAYKYNMALMGRGKKTWKSADLVMMLLYKFLFTKDPSGSDTFLIANNQAQAEDDLLLLKRIVEANPILSSDVDILDKKLRSRHGEFYCLPYANANSLHGKSYLTLGIDECHGWTNWRTLEALQLDPHRKWSQILIATYDSIAPRAGQPLHDIKEQAIAGKDPRLYFSWYSGDFTTDSAWEKETEGQPERRANPSLDNPAGREYLEQQRRRLPANRYRRLHLNLPSEQEGSAYAADSIDRCTVKGRTYLPFVPGRRYAAFVDPSGGSSDDFTVAISHKEYDKLVLDRVAKQSRKPPFDPRQAVEQHARLLAEFRISTVYGDRYGGETYRRDFGHHGISYVICDKSATALYEDFEVLLNSGAVELLDDPLLQQQLLGLVWKGNSITHPSGQHDDIANSAVGALLLTQRRQGAVGETFLTYREASQPGWTHGNPEPSHANLSDIGVEGGETSFWDSY